MEATATDTRKPVLPRPGSSRPAPEELEGLRRAHLGIDAAGIDPGAWCPLLPSSLDASAPYPFLLMASEEAGGETAYLAFDEVAAMTSDRERVRALAPRLEELVREAGGALDAQEAIRRLPGSAGDEVVAELGTALPPGGTLVASGPGAPLRLLDHALGSRFRAAWAGFADERRQLAEMLRGSLASRADRAGDPEALRREVGELGSRFLNPERMAEVLGSRYEAIVERDQRRHHALEQALARLERSLDPARQPRLVLFHDGSADPDALAALSGWEVETAEDPCAAALRRWNQEAADVAGVLRDMRLARLEIEGRYDPARHDPWLQALSWETFLPSELALVSPVVALVREAAAAGPVLPSLSRLLRSGRPVRILVLADPTRDAEDPGASRFEAGYLGLSHRDAFVQQTTVARPDHMLHGFLRAAPTGHPALHVIAAGAGVEEPAPRVTAEAAVWSRAWPLFVFDPDAGATWARRLEFAGNVDPDADWAERVVLAVREGGSEEERRDVFTYADFALLDPGHAAEFHPVSDAWKTEDLVPLAEYLELDPERAAGRLPFVWALDGSGTLHRLLVTARLTAACRDRLDSWRTLQELAGVRNPYAEEAAARAREEARREAREAMTRLQADHEAQLRRVQETAAEEAIRRLTALLLDMDPAELPSPPQGPALPVGDPEELARTLLQMIDLERLEEEASGSAEAPRPREG